MSSLTVDSALAPWGIRVASAVVSGVHNGTVPSTLENLRRAAALRVIETATSSEIADDPILQEFRALHERVGGSASRSVAAPEALLRAVIERRAPSPSINPIVDVYNLVSLETRLAIGAHDLVAIDGVVHLRFATGAERFHPLGGAGQVRVHPGEYVYVDDEEDVLCRLEVRQSEKTKITAETTEVLIIVQGNRAVSQDCVDAATARVVHLIEDVCGGEATLPTW